MNKLKWWLRIVGVFYLLLTLMNLYILFFSDGQMIANQLPAPMNTDPLASQAFADMSLIFVLELGVLGAMSLVASRDPDKNRIMAWVIIWAELFRGVVGDVIWIARGYNAVTYIVFAVIHLAIALTGIMFLRQTKAE
jgi:hypothetical protein